MFHLISNPVGTHSQRVDGNPERRGHMFSLFLIEHVPFRIVLLDQQEVLGGKLTEAVAKAFDALFSFLAVLFFGSYNFGVVWGLLRLCKATERFGFSFNPSPVFFEKIHRHAVKERIRAVSLNVSALGDSTRDPVNRPVRVFLKRQTASPSEQLHKPPANLFILFGGAVAIGIELLKQPVERFTR
jgi:hypothetical protein